MNKIEKLNPTEVVRKVTGMLRVFSVLHRNRFKFKSLSDFSFNPVLGCMHACAFCYVASLVRFRKKLLEALGIRDPDGDWGKYALVKLWDEKKFLASLRKAEALPPEQLSHDGHRAVIFSSTTDAYSVLNGGDLNVTKKANELLQHSVQRALELILKESTLNVRILTRSPLARRDFDLMRQFGPRLLFGMSLPTLDNKLARIYEPGAPAPTARLETLRLAKEAGLKIFVAVAPTYPECTRQDLEATLKAIKELDPVTIFHEPINIRAKNAERISLRAATMGVRLDTSVYESGKAWRRYAVQQLKLVEEVANDLGLGDRLHLWPDKCLLTKASLAVQPDPEAFKKWIQHWHNRVSEWPST